jgi:hypothetical protein
MIASFIASEYEYNKVQEKYQAAFNEANATLWNQSNITKNETLLRVDTPKIHYKVFEDEEPMILKNDQ